MKDYQAKKETNTRTKLTAIIISMLVCLLVIGITVFAATNNQVTIGDSISISQSGSAFVSVRVDRKLGGSAVFNTLSGDAAKVAEILNTSSSSFIEMISVSPGQNDSTTAAAKGMPNVEFSPQNGYTYVVYKITLTNEDNQPATYQITGFPAASSWDDASSLPQVEYFYSDGTSMLTSAILGAGGAGFQGTLNVNPAVGFTRTIYIVAAVTAPLAGLTPVSPQAFNIQIGVRGNAY